MATVGSGVRTAVRTADKDTVRIGIALTLESMHKEAAIKPRFKSGWCVTIPRVSAS